MNTNSKTSAYAGFRDDNDYLYDSDMPSGTNIEEENETDRYNFFPDAAF